MSSQYAQNQREISFEFSKRNGEMQVFKIILFFICLISGMPIMDESVEEINERMISTMQNMSSAIYSLVWLRRVNAKIIKHPGRMPFKNPDPDHFVARIKGYIAQLNAQMDLMNANDD